MLVGNMIPNQKKLKIKIKKKSALGRILCTGSEFQSFIGFAGHQVFNMSTVDTEQAQTPGCRISSSLSVEWINKIQTFGGHSSQYPNPLGRPLQ